MLFRSRIIDELRRWNGNEETLSRMESALALAARGGGDVSALGLGWVGEEALAIGLYSTLASASFNDAMVIASNHDGDSDSTAAIAGQIYGAWKGMNEIPHNWILALDVLEPLLDLIAQANAVI